MSGTVSSLLQGNANNPPVRITSGNYGVQYPVFPPGTTFSPGVNSDTLNQIAQFAAANGGITDEYWDHGGIDEPDSLFVTYGASNGQHILAVESRDTFLATIPSGLQASTSSDLNMGDNGDITPTSPILNIPTSPSPSNNETPPPANPTPQGPPSPSSIGPSLLLSILKNLESTPFIQYAAQGIGQAAGIVSTVLSAATVGQDLANIATDIQYGENPGQDFATFAHDFGVGLGAIIGGTAGGGLGTAIEPGAGTAVGATGGGIAGALIGGLAGDAIGAAGEAIFNQIYGVPTP